MQHLEGMHPKQKVIRKQLRDAPDPEIAFRDAFERFFLGKVWPLLYLCDVGSAEPTGSATEEMALRRKMLNFGRDEIPAMSSAHQVRLRLPSSHKNRRRALRSSSRLILE